VKNFENRISKLESIIFKRDDTRCSVVIYNNNEILIDKKNIAIPEGKTKEQMIIKYHLDNKIPFPPRRFVIPSFGFKQ
jgi:hypothetical protein